MEESDWGKALTLTSVIQSIHMLYEAIYVYTQVHIYSLMYTHK